MRQGIYWKKQVWMLQSKYDIDFATAQMVLLIGVAKTNKKLGLKLDRNKRMYKPQPFSEAIL